jgi:DNA primase
MQPESNGEAPEAVWQHRGRTFLQDCQSSLWSPVGRSAVAWLAERRGLTSDTILARGLGYNPADCWETMIAWGLDEHVPVKRVWLPHGIVIPCTIDGAIWFIKVRRLGTDQRGKYVHVRGSSSALLGAETIRPNDQPRAVVVLTEGEFDAMLLDQEAGDLAGVASFGSASARLSTRWLWLLRDARHILVAYDLDEAGTHGAARNIASPRATLAPPIGVKDLSDMHVAGGDLRSWVAFHLQALDCPAEREIL